MHCILLMMGVPYVQPPPRHGVLRWGIFESIGIFAVSVSGHSSLPVLRNSMKQPQVVIQSELLEKSC